MAFGTGSLREWEKEGAEMVLVGGEERAVVSV